MRNIQTTTIILFDSNNKTAKQRQHSFWWREARRVCVHFFSLKDLFLIGKTVCCEYSIYDFFE